MRQKTTVLRPQRDREFLDAQHRDPVTGVTFVAGDSITRCAACLLPFLQESWIGIGATHCGQFSSVGLEVTEAAVEAATNGNEMNSEARNPGVESGSNLPAAKSSEKIARQTARLLPIPIKLHEIPIALG